MKIKLPITILLLVTSNFSDAQYAWYQKANVGGMNRQNAVGFAAGQYGYIGTGRNLETQTVLRDFWRYDPANDTWTQVADFGGTARYAASCFVINDTAYVGCGNENIAVYHFVKDFWKYNQGTNTWIKVADFGGNARYAAPAFAIDTKGYVGTGYDQVTPRYQDFWEYNSITDTWVQEADFPGGSREHGVGFAIDNYGYMGTGWDNSSSSDFYKYDPSNNAWTQIADLPTAATSATCFVLNNEGYVGTGSVTYPAVNFFSHFWYYTPATNTWTAIADCSPTPRFNAVAFSIGSAGYCGTGGFLDFFNHDTVDFWKYAPSAVGITDITKEECDINIFPNPVNEKLNVTVNNKELSEIILYNVTSGKILQQQFSNSVSLNTAQLLKGIYLYEVRNKNGVIKKGKVVKD
ncbi:MAG: kelch repeat-containing protein [Bacteroidia bacterium]